jgi:hypothetical protein
MFHPWMKVAAYFHHALDRAYFHIRGEKNPKTSLTFLQSALTIILLHFSSNNSC